MWICRIGERNQEIRIKVDHHHLRPKSSRVSLSSLRYRSPCSEVTVGLARSPSASRGDIPAISSMLGIPAVRSATVSSLSARSNARRRASDLAPPHFRANRSQRATVPGSKATVVRRYAHTMSLSNQDALG